MQRLASAMGAVPTNSAPAATARACLVEAQRCAYASSITGSHGQGFAELNRWPGPGRCLVNTSASSKRKRAHGQGFAWLSTSTQGQGLSG